MGERQTVGPGAEIEVGAPAQPLPQDIELALRDVVQDRADIAFACVPVIAFPDQPPTEVLVVFLRRGVDPETLLTELAAEVERAVSAAAAAAPRERAVELAVLPISLGFPLDGLAQAVLQSGTELHVADAAAWEAARRPPRPLWQRLLWPWGR